MCFLGFIYGVLKLQVTPFRCSDFAIHGVLLLALLHCGLGAAGTRHSVECSRAFAYFGGGAWQIILPGGGCRQMWKRRKKVGKNWRYRM